MRLVVASSVMLQLRPPATARRRCLEQTPLEAPVEAGAPKENAMVLVIELEEWEGKSWTERKRQQDLFDQELHPLIAGSFDPFCRPASPAPSVAGAFSPSSFFH
jgi:hypothetical protein